MYIKYLLQLDKCFCFPNFYNITLDLGVLAIPFHIDYLQLLENLHGTSNFIDSVIVLFFLATVLFICPVCSALASSAIPKLENHLRLTHHVIRSPNTYSLIISWLLFDFGILLLMIGLSLGNSKTWNWEYVLATLIIPYIGHGETSNNKT